METYFNETSCYIYLLIALLLLLAEIFVPSFGTLSILALLACIAAVISAFHASVAMGITVTVIVIIGFPLIIMTILKNLHRMPIGKLLIPPAPEFKPTKEEEDLNRLLSKTGVTLTQLRPSGIVRIDGHRYDVLTDGEFLDANTKVVVKRIEGNRIFVQASRGDL